ncbi:uncharacterized protein LOC134208209 [Armigeres subalbatus]|uniref:uncharacterized protein LOC134208209 n=1 Tax=Armigeres subalbatus TaxID=124917 RepID=UPI002ED36BAB
MRINTAIPSSLTGNVAIDLPSESAEQKLMLLRQFYSSPYLNDTFMVGWSGPGFINDDGPSTASDFDCYGITEIASSQLELVPMECCIQQRSTRINRSDCYCSSLRFGTWLPIMKSRVH